MNKRLLPVLLLVLLCGVIVFSCKKSSNNKPVDATRLYFPLTIGKSVDYAVDSTVYVDTICKTFKLSSQIRYTVSDTFRDQDNRLSYLIDVFSRANASAAWQAQSVIYATPTDTSLEWVQSTLRFVKLRFPAQCGYSWKGNWYIEQRDTPIHYFNNWNYSYQNCQQPYSDGYVNFDNTITVLQDDETKNNPNVDLSLPAYRTYAKEVYAFNIGLVYKELTHWTYAPDTATCLKGYSVIMRAIDHN